PLEEAGGGPGVGDGVGGDPAAGGVADAPAGAGELADVVGVGGDDEGDGAVAGAQEDLGGGVEAGQRGVDLDGAAGVGGGVEHGVDVEVDAGAAADAAAGQVADDVHGRVPHGRDEARGLAGRLQIEVRMDGGDAPVEAAAELLVVVEPAVGADVELDAVQDAQVGVALLQQIGRASCRVGMWQTSGGALC